MFDFIGTKFCEISRNSCSVCRTQVCIFYTVRIYFVHRKPVFCIAYACRFYPFKCHMTYSTPFIVRHRPFVVYRTSYIVHARRTIVHYTMLDSIIMHTVRTYAVPRNPYRKSTPCSVYCRSYAVFRISNVVQPYIVQQSTLYVCSRHWAVLQKD
jgi:hypothetical protein